MSSTTIRGIDGAGLVANMKAKICEVGHRTLDRSPTDAQREVCPTCPIFHLKVLAGAFGQYMKRVFGIEVVSRGKKGPES